jgi:methylated-DNA-[protein]-cysteine S-methyltransferase
VCAARHLDRAASELERYFAGDSTAFDIDVDLGPLDGFARAVLEATRRIIFGRVATYSEIAAFAGDPRAARSVGGILGANPLCVIVPCHRVVPRGGGLGGYVAGVAIKEQLLRLEGVRLL